MAKIIKLKYASGNNPPQFNGGVGAIDIFDVTADMVCLASVLLQSRSFFLFLKEDCFLVVKCASS